MKENVKTPLSGGNKDEIGIAPAVKESSTEKNAKDPATSAAGANLKPGQPPKN